MKAYLSGSAFDSSEGNNTFLRIDGQTRGMPQKRGLNTVILRPDGTHKAKANHDVYGYPDFWNNWADWVSAQADDGDIVAVASYDAIRSAPRGGQAATLLSAIDAKTAFKTEGPGDWRNVRTPYALLFVMGGSSCNEEHHYHEGPNTHLRVVLNNIHLRGSAFESIEGNNTYLELNGSSMNMSAKRGLNTVVLNSNLTFKAQANHDIYGSQGHWSTWADWVNTSAKDGDIVAVASYDAVKNAPGRGKAADLLRSIGAVKAFNMTIGSDWRRERASYALLFTAGSQQSLEVSEQLTGPNAHIYTTLITPTSELSSRSVMKFNSAGTYLSSEIDVSESDFTVSIWFKTANDSCGIFSVDAGERGVDGHDRHLYLQSGNIVARLWRNETIATSGFNYADKQWHRVTYVVGQSVGGQRIYVDGVLKASGSKSRSDFDGQTGINIGFSNDAANNYFDGDIAEVSLWSVTRSERDTKAWLERVVGSESGLQALWSFSDRTGTVVSDVTNNNHNATVHGTPDWMVSDDFPGEFLPNIVPKDLDIIRVQSEELAKVGTTLGKGFVDLPPANITPKPLDKLITSGLLPQYDLKEQLENAVSDGKLVLNDSLLGQYGEIAGFAADVLSVFVSIRKPKIEFVSGEPGMVGAPGMETVVNAEGSTKLATPENHSLKVTGDVELFGGAAFKLQADFFVYKNKPKCSFKFSGNQPLGVGAFLPGVPLIQALKMSGPTLIVCNGSTLYDPTLDSGINEGFNFFGNLKIAESDDKAMQFIGGLLSVKELAVHAAIDTSTTPRKIILEAAVQREVTLLDGKDLKLRFTRSDVGLEISGLPPEPTVSVGNDLVLSLGYGGEDTDLVFTGGMKVQPESISGFFTLNGTGRATDGGLTGENQNTGEWKHPFGIPGIIIRQMSLQLGGTYAAPWIDNVGVHGNMKIGDVDGSMSVLVDANDPDQFVLAGSSDVLTMVQIMSAMSPPTFAAYQALPASVTKVINKVVDVKLEDVKVNIVPSATSIGGVHFRDEGITVSGKLTAWGWSASAFINVDTRDGITVRGDMDPINLYEVFKITGAQANQAPILRTQVAPGSVPQVYISGMVSLLGLTAELEITADSSGLNFSFEANLGSILQNSLVCTYGDGNFAAEGSINFNLNVTIPTRLGDIPLVDIGLNAAAVLRVGAIDGFFMSLNGDFRFYGKTVTLPELKLSIAPKDFHAVFNAVIKQIQDNALDLLGPIFETLEKWAKAVKDGVIRFTGEVAEVALNHYRASKDEAVKAYKTLSRTANEVAKGLRQVYRASAKDVATALKKASYAINDVADALEDAFNLGANQAAKVLKQVGYTANQVAGALKNAFGVTTKMAASALKQAGYTVNQIGGALKSAFSASQTVAADALRYAGYGANEVGGALKSGYRATASSAAQALKVAGYGVNEVGGALKSTYRTSATVAAQALKTVGYGVNEVGGALKTTFRASANDSAQALKQAGYGVNEVGKFAKNVYGLGPDALKNTLKGAGYATHQIEGLFKNLGGEFNKLFDDVEDIVGGITGGITGVIGGIF